MRKIVFVFVVITVAFFERVFYDLGPNVELITLAMVLSYLVFGTHKSLLITFGLLMLTDLVIGNTNIFLFTWSGFLLPILFFSVIKSKSKILGGTIMALVFNLFFFFWTNFGVWYLDVWGMYANDITGLANSYFNGLPFLKLHLVNTALTVPVGVWMFEKIEKLNPASKSHLQRLLRSSQLARV
ncbi:DUF6580 family putative transport protein [Patescibacteria group bacterium]